MIAGKGRPVMDWGLRLKIALGSAKGLAYLHEDCMKIPFLPSHFELISLNFIHYYDDNIRKLSFIELKFHFL